LVELVSDEQRPAARSGLCAALECVRAGEGEAYLQTAPSSLAEDLGAGVWPGLAGVVISRAESARDVEHAATLLDALEKKRNIEPGTVKIVAALETAKGNHAAYEVLSASPRVCGATLGRADLIMDLRPEPSGEIHLMEYLMQRLVIVAATVGVTPLGAWWRAPDRGLLAAPENTYQAAYRGRAIGFKGAMCLRGDQVDPLNRAFKIAASPDARSAG
jgi:citrate lyase subunit beta/citryl-CoA lyase